MKKLLIAIISVVMLLSVAATFTACNNPVSEKGTIGLLMPTQDLQRWNQDGAALKEYFRDEGYDVDLQFAANNAATQLNQLGSMVTKGVKAIVVCPISSGSLNNGLAQAKEKGIFIIAYDRMLTDTLNIDYYATFDNFQVGVAQGEFIVDALDLENEDGPFNIEFIAGDPDDTNAPLFFAGAWSVLEDYIDDGVLVIPSGRDEFRDFATVGWSTQTATTNFASIITAQQYAPAPAGDQKKLDAVCASNDSTAQGVTQALKNAGFTAATMPVLTGQDCDKASVQNMIDGFQTMSVFKDTRILARQAVKMTIQAISGETVEVNINGTAENQNDDYNNGAKDVPTYLCKVISSTRDTIQKDLFDTYYYYASDFTGTWKDKK